jgi:hypothetical protein
VDAKLANTNANKGIVDNFLAPYPPLLDKMKELNFRCATGPISSASACPKSNVK